MPDTKLEDLTVLGAITTAANTLIYIVDLDEAIDADQDKRLAVTVLDNRYLLESNNLSDLDNAATARTNLGLVAGGAGDIWVEKAGDTMTGNLTIFNTKPQLRLEESDVPQTWRIVASASNLYFRDETGGNVDVFEFHAGANDASFVVQPTVVIVNQLWNDLDFNVRGQVDTYLLRTDAANDAIGIGVLAPSAKLHIDQYSGTGAKPVLLLDQADISEEFIRFKATVGAGNPIDTAALGLYYGKVRVHVDGVGDKWLALYD